MKPIVSISRIADQKTYADLKEAFDRLGSLTDLIPPGSTIVVNQATTD